MNGNAAHRSADFKQPGLIKKFSTWKRYFDDDEMGYSGSESKSLLENLHLARQEWLNATANFDQAEEQDMIDYYIYRMKACQVRYNYLLKKAKEMGLRRDAYEA